MNIKKLSVFFLILVSLSAGLLFASPAFTLAESAGAELYDDTYSKVAIDTEIAKSGYTIRTGGETAVLKSDFAEIYIAPNSIFAFTDFTLDHPSIYLVDGTVNLYLLYPQDNAITCNTPTSSFELSNAGEYVAVSTEDEEKVYNFTDSPITLFDNLRGKTYTTDSYTYHDMITEESELPVDKELYSLLSIFGKESQSKVAIASAPVSITMTSVVKAEEPSSPALPSIPVFTKTTSSPFVPAAPAAPRMTVNTEEIIRIPSYPDFVAVHVVQKITAPKIIPIDAPKVVAVYPEVLKAPEVTVSTEVAPTEIIETPEPDASGVEKKNRSSF